jgi:hypothetical protein
MIVNSVFVAKAFNFGYRTSFQLIDKGNIEYSTPAGIAFALQRASQKGVYIQSGFISNYALTFTLASFFIFFAFVAVFFSNEINFFVETFFCLVFCYIITSFG